MKKLVATLMLLPALAFGINTIELNEENTINFNQAFDSSFVAKKQVEAISLCAKNVGKTIYVVLYSPGGSVSAGQLFFDTLNALPCTFNTITIFSASMAYQTVQNLGKRYILPSGILMSHRARISGLSGEIGGELDQIMKLLKDNITNLEEVAAKRVGISLEKYRSDISDELWLTSSEAIRTNHADEITLAKCSDNLNGTSWSTVMTFFGPVDVELSDCPLVVGPLNIRFRRSNVSFTQMQKVKHYLSNIKERIETTL